MELKKTVCYEDFGAIGDGKTDDFDAMARAHAYANEHKLDVVIPGSKTYYIGKTEKDNPKDPIMIKTNVDFGNATIIIDDSEIECDMPKGCTFRIDRDTETVLYTPENDTPNGAIARINAEGGFKADIKSFDLGLGYSAMLMVINENHKNYIRYGVNAGSGSAQKELVNIDADGVIDPSTAFLLDYDEVTHIYVLREDEPITIKGGRFVHIANRSLEKYSYYNRGFYVTRARVTVTGMTYEIVGEGEHGNPYSGFLTFHECSNILVENCTLQAHKTYYFSKPGGVEVGMGTYALSMGSSNNLTFINCIQSNFFEDDGVTTNKSVWGIQGSNLCKNITYQDSLLSRFDAHLGCRNANIVNSHVQHFRIIGGGTIRVENSHVYGGLLIGLREDYGSTWKGDIVMKDVTLHNGDRNATLLYARWANHNFGYPTYMPENIIVDNLSITDGDTVYLVSPPFVEQSKNILKDEIDGVPNQNKMVAPKKIIIKNNKAKLKYILPDSDFFKNTEIIIED